MGSAGHNMGADVLTRHHPNLLSWMSQQLLSSTPKTQPVLQNSAIKTFPLERRHIPAQFSLLRRGGFSGDNCSETNLHHTWVLTVLQGARELPIFPCSRPPECMPWDKFQIRMNLCCSHYLLGWL